ncbi:MAG TPA: ATP-binding protein [Candidatus Binatia bacterium]|jgi:serine/threonine-protein kinase RsbW|nr:ATP-binding protein [Candidatus Binatia bacterium]
MVTPSDGVATDADRLFRYRNSASYMEDKKESLTVPGRYAEIRHICDFVAQGATQAGFDDDAIFQVQLACDEACTNIIEHTYEAEDAGDIQVTWEIGRRYFKIVIEDNGKEFNPGEIPPAPVPPPPVQVENDDNFDVRVGGLGVYFMRKLMDKVTFDYAEGSGNVLTMVKRLPEK